MFISFALFLHKKCSLNEGKENVLEQIKEERGKANEREREKKAETRRIRSCSSNRLFLLSLSLILREASHKIKQKPYDTTRSNLVNFLLCVMNFLLFLLHSFLHN